MASAESDAGRAHDTPSPGLRWDRAETATLVAVLVAMFVAFQWKLRSVIITDMDEGTYLYAGQLIADGLVPYRDFLIAHPPLVPLLAAGWFETVGTTLMSARVAYLVLVLASTVPLYALTRRIGSHIAALIAIAAYMAGMLMLSNMGRTVRLEPAMNAFLIAAFAIRFLRPTSVPWTLVAGAALALGGFVKLNTVIPAGLLFIADFVWERPLAGVVRRWSLMTAGALLVLVPVLFWCFSQPHFARDVLESQVNRPRLGLELRGIYLMQNLRRFPPIALSLIAAAYFLLRSQDARLKILSFVTLGNAFLLVFAFRTFFSYYIVQVLPWIACLFSLVTDQVGARFLRERWRLASWVVVGTFAALAPIGYAEVYERHGATHVAGPQRILPLLEKRSGYLYSMYPAFALWSGRALYPWYHRADSLVGRINHWIGDDDFRKVFAGCSTLVLDVYELKEYPRARAFVEANFREEYRDDAWVVWQRRDSAPEVRPH